MTVDDFSVLDVARLEVRLRAREPASLPPFLGSTLRGALGHALKLVVCVVDHGDCSRCPIARQCFYPYFFETPVPPGIAHLCGQRHAPLPFILEPPIVLNPVKRVWRLPAASVQEPTGAAAAACVGQHETAARRAITISERKERGTGRSLASNDALLGRDGIRSASRVVASRKGAVGRETSVVTSIVLPDQSKRCNAGEDLSFGLTLLGRAIEFLPYVVFAIAEMARRGLGASRASFDLEEVWLKGASGRRELIYFGADSRLNVPRGVSQPLSELISERLSDLQANKVASSEDKRISRSKDEESRHCSSASRTLEEAIAERLSELRSAIPDTDVSDHRELISQSTETGRESEYGRYRDEVQDAKPEHRLKLRFLTPARIRVQGDLQTWLSFELLVRNLLRRISTSAAVHGRNHLDLDYRGLIERARTVKTHRTLLRWWDLERYSNRQAEKLKVGGLIGDIEYEGEVVEEYVSLLAAGELLQVGTGASYGLGRYQIVRV